MTAKTSNKRSSNRGNNPGTTAEISGRSSSEPRRANKPLMEKRRRARINQSLAVLKTLILDSAKSDNTKHSKLEKADILELTVRHFQRHRNLDTPGVNKYRAGYADCVREVQRYLDTPDAQTMCVIEPGIRQRLLRHLENCVSEIDTDISPTVATPPQETVYKEVIVNDKRIPMATIKCEPITIPQLPTDIMYSTRIDDDTTEQEKKTRLEPDSSTAEEINNNAEPNYRNENVIARIEEVGVTQQVTLPNQVIKMYDGNFVFVLPSHYIQLAAALGINLNNQVNPVPVLETSQIPDAATVAATAAPPESQIPVAVNGPDKPLDFSKNNDVNDMWRPW